MTTSRGFTLVEVMVVLVILGLTAVFATLGFQRLESDRLEQQAGQLSAWLQTLSDNAVLDSAVYGAWREPAGTRLGTGFYLDNRWWPVAGEEAQSPVLDPDIGLLLEEGEEWRALAADAGDDDLRPQMLFLPTGIALPDALDLVDRQSGRRARIERDANGLFTWRML